MPALPAKVRRREGGHFLCEPDPTRVRGIGGCSTAVLSAGGRGLRGRKSLPTMDSRTEDLPALWPPTVCQGRAREHRQRLQNFACVTHCQRAQIVCLAWSSGASGDEGSLQGSTHANLRELDRAEPQTIEDILEIVYERNEALHSLTLAGIRHCQKPLK